MNEKRPAGDSETCLAITVHRFAPNALPSEDSPLLCGERGCGKRRHGQVRVGKCANGPGNAAGSHQYEKSAAHIGIVGKESGRAAGPSRGPP